MAYAWKRTTEPAANAVSLTEFKAHCRVRHSDDDTLMTAVLAAATAYVEDVLGKSLVTQSWTLSLDRLPARTVYLPMGPLVSVTSVKYTPVGGSETTVSSALYSAWPANDSLSLTDGSSWPSATVEPGGVEIEYVAGKAAADLTAHEKLLINLVGAHWYIHREAAATESVEGIGLGFASLVAVLKRNHWYKPW